MDDSQRSLFIFLDDSGNFDFSPRGTRHFVLCAVTTTDPVTSSLPLQHLKYQLLRQGVDVECFHASPDKQKVRDAVYQQISNLDTIQYHYVYADKRKTYPVIQSPPKFYALFGRTILNNIFNSWSENQYSQVVIIFDKALVKREREAFLKSVKPKLKMLGKPFRIYFHRTAADFNGQIADYGSWAKFVSLERNEQRPLQALGNIPKTMFDIFAKGNEHYY